MDAFVRTHCVHVPWNKGKLTGQKPPLKLKEIWSIRIRLQLNKPKKPQLPEDLSHNDSVLGGPIPASVCLR